MWPEARFHVDPNGTHQEFLSASLYFLLKSSLPNQTIQMLEIGTGGSSSKTMRSFLETYKNLQLISFENDRYWYDVYVQQYAKHERHKLVFVENETWHDELNQFLQVDNSKFRILAFIDSSPWESRVTALKLLIDKADILLIHDVDYFPHNQIFGQEIKPIRYAPANPFFYGKLKRKNLGLRNYNEIAQSWMEVFPAKPGYFTGPPTLIASNFMDVHAIPLPRSSIILGKSNGLSLGK